MKIETKAVLSGRNSTKHSGSVNPPVHRTSTVLFPTLKDYISAEKGKPFYETSKDIESSDFSYATTGTPTSFALQKTIAELEGGGQTIITPSGLCAISLALISHVSHGDHILVVDTAYGPTRRFCNKELKRYGVETTYYDPAIGKDIEHLIQKNTSIILTESPGSLTFEIQDIPAITKIAKKHNITVMMDNSWATPLFFNAFDHGIDISIHAGTKYIGGHSDVLLGTITAKGDTFKKIFKTYRNFGATASPDDCYLASRGIRTMHVRLKQHEQSALTVAKWLEKQPQVSRVLHPALPSFPGHNIFKRDFKGSTGLFAFVLNKPYTLEAISQLTDHLEYFGIGCSWGGYESLILPVDPTTTRSATKWTEKNSLIRLFIGLEHPDDLIKDLEKGLKHLANA